MLRYVVYVVLCCTLRLCCLMLCYVVLCCDMLLSVALCCLMLPYVVYVVLCCTMLSLCCAICCLMLRFVVLCCAMLSYVVLCRAMLRYVVLCYRILRYVVLCCAMVPYAVICCPMLRYVELLRSFIRGGIHIPFWQKRYPFPIGEKIPVLEIVSVNIYYIFLAEALSWYKDEEVRWLFKQIAIQCINHMRHILLIGFLLSWTPSLHVSTLTC